MTKSLLRDYRLLVVEDEYLLADDLCNELTDAGAVVVGVAGTVDDAFACLDEAIIEA